MAKAKKAKAKKKAPSAKAAREFAVELAQRSGYVIENDGDTLTVKDVPHNVGGKHPSDMVL